MALLPFTAKSGGECTHSGACCKLVIGCRFLVCENESRVPIAESVLRLMQVSRSESGENNVFLWISYPHSGKLLALSAKKRRRC